ncbi:beta-glucoside-specific PTS transporter subunit IIABC [Streptococcus pneumoniae]
MKYKETAQAILKAVGGEANVVSATHCVTRLRLVLKDEQAVSDDVVKNIPNVIGVMRKNGQYQVILGNDVANYYQAFAKLGHFGGEAQPSTEKKGNVFATIIEYIAGSMTPLIPAMLGGGMLKVLVIILPMLGLLPADSQTIAFLSVFGDAPYYFMPIFLGFSAAKKLHVTPILAMSVAGILLHPNFVQMVNDGNPMALFGAPVTPANYGSSVIPILIMVWLMKYIETAVNKVVPAVTKSFLQPTIVLFISGFIALVLVGPLGVIVGDGLSNLIQQMYGAAGWLTLAILGAIMPFIVMTGMHWAFAPIFLAASVATPDVLILPAMLGANLAQGAASMAVALKSKNQNTKQIAFAAGFSALLAGITEPALYGVTLKYKKPIYAAMIGGGVAGLFAGIVGLRAYLFAVPSLIALPQFINADQPANFTNALIAAALSITISFVLAYILGIDEEPQVTNLENVPTGASTTKKIVSPLKGKVLPLEQVNDETFAGKLLGEGIAIVPSNGTVVSPIKGVVSSVFPTKHAIGLISEDGVEVLIHFGLETVNLKGEGFTSFVKEGDSVQQGDKLLEVNLDDLIEKGYDVTTPIIVTNTQTFLDVLPMTDKTEVEKGDDILAIL